MLSECKKKPDRCDVHPLFAACISFTTSDMEGLMVLVAAVLKFGSADSADDF